MSGKTKKVINRTALIRLAIILVWIASISYIVLSGRGHGLTFSPLLRLFCRRSASFCFCLCSYGRLSKIAQQIPVDDDGFPAESYDYSAHKVADPLQRLALFMLPPVFLLIFGVQAIDTSSLFGSGTGRLIQAGAEAEGLEIGGESGYIEITPVDLYGSQARSLHREKGQSCGNAR
ncbi:MAG: hypothetical protein U5N86_03535 [Planctomycetota bacterium]|nr:hypothetical protein [Planctomycetota bacterium]